MIKYIIVGTRTSELALTQTKWIVKHLKKKYPDHNFVIKKISTTGDEVTNIRLDRFKDLGVFVKELQIALLNRDIDIAIHSLKDIPENEPQGLDLVSFPIREKVFDLLISKIPINDLPDGSHIGTGSPRRILQIQNMFPNFTFEAVRGNLNTRLQKLENNEIDALILAHAGVSRLDWFNSKLTSLHTHTFPVEQIIPAIGQGCLAIETRSEENKLKEIIRSINHPITEKCVLLERNFMKTIGGGCKVPMAAYCEYTENNFQFQVMIGSAENKKTIFHKSSLPSKNPEKDLKKMVAEISEKCQKKGITLPQDLPEHSLFNHSLFSKPTSQ